MASPSQTNTISFNTDFCLQLAYRILQKQVQKGSNFLSSPLSLHIILSLVAAGSKGKTLEQLLSFLGSQSKDDLNFVSSHFVSSLRNVEGTENGGPILSFANGAWVEKTFGLKTSFEEVAKNFYRSQIEQVDFINKAKKVAHEINSWVENATNGLIKEILPSGSIDEETELVLANALYFKGAWNQKFHPAMTKTRSFNLLNGENVQVPFMTSMPREEYYYNSFENHKVLTIPYQSGSNPLKFAISHRGHEGTGTNFTFHSWELTEVSDSSYSHKLYVSNILQKTFVEVNEEGTEAAASTAALLVPTSFRPMPKPSFVADHPFIFMIREETSMAVFFIGAVLNPLLAS
ncbi:hypothetical protein K1719_044586 [Acacia pycnantha]|nr:hypothetical protein K1719_044586 [Acacia pycnantha]